MWASDQPTFTEGTELYVVASSGLTMRTNPDMRAKSVGVIPYGASVIAITQNDSLIKQRINWVEGSWIHVEYDGMQGYMFDGYLTDLPLPLYEFEMCAGDLDILYPLENYIDVNMELAHSDTSETLHKTRMVKYDDAGNKMVRIMDDNFYTMELYMSDVRIMDVYHLLMSMVPEKSGKKVFLDNTTFIENKMGNLSQIKINLETPIKIKMMENDQIKISMTTAEYHCVM